MGRRTEGQTELLKEKFLESFARLGVVTYAAREAGIPRRVVYVWREHDGQFAVAYQQAEIEAVESLEAEARRRAVDGVEKPVFQGGKQVGTIREYSDTLLIFLLKGAKPHVYRDNVRVDMHVAQREIEQLARDRGIDAQQLVALAERIVRESAQTSRQVVEDGEGQGGIS